MFICLHIVCGCFYSTVAEFNRRDRDYMAYKTKKIYYLGVTGKTCKPSEMQGLLIQSKSK